MIFPDHAEPGKRAGGHGAGDDPALARPPHTIQFKEVVENGHRRTMGEPDVREKNYGCSECGRTCGEIYGEYGRRPHCGAVVEDAGR